MAWDGMYGQEVKFGDNVSLFVSGQDHSQLSETFHRLSACGKVDTPLTNQFWGDTYGVLTDKFGVHWMVNIAAPQAR